LNASPDSLQPRRAVKIAPMTAASVIRNISRSVIFLVPEDRYGAKAFKDFSVILFLEGLKNGSSVRARGTV